MATEIRYGDNFIILTRDDGTEIDVEVNVVKANGKTVPLPIKKLAEIVEPLR